MMKADDCRECAAYMHRLADGAQTDVLRATFLRLEQEWLEQAHTVETALAALHRAETAPVRRAG